MKEKLKKLMYFMLVTIITFVIFDIAVKSTVAFGLVTSVIMVNPTAFSILASYVKYCFTVYWLKWLHETIKR